MDPKEQAEKFEDPRHDAERGFLEDTRTDDELTTELEGDADDRGDE